MSTSTKMSSQKAATATATALLLQLAITNNHRPASTPRRTTRKNQIRTRSSRGLACSNSVNTKLPSVGIKNEMNLDGLMKSLTSSSSGGGAAARCVRTEYRSGRVLARSSAADQPSVYTPPTHPSGSSIHVKVIGVGSRGASALEKLVAKEGFGEQAELWCLDVDAGVLDRVAPFASTVLVPKEAGKGSPSQGPLSYEDLQTIVGQTASDAEGRGNIGSAVDGGVAFVLAPAAAGPGGPELVLELVSALRAAGHFTVAAVTRPFGFEGSGKLDQAGSLIAALEDTAHLVAVMEQDVLMQAFGDSQLTVAEATDIADNALEHTARSILQAVQAQELLKSNRGGLMWHGRDLRHFRRLLSPPLQQLLTCPGTAVLGRGLATLPAQTAHEMGASQALMHLASDAVIAAGESPFLDGALDDASAVLCCITLPAVHQLYREPNGSLIPLRMPRASDAERQTTRLAAQAAAGAVRSITGRGCDDFVLCVEPAPPETLDGVDPEQGADHVRVEATLLVVRAPSGAAGKGSSGGQSSTSPRTTQQQQQQQQKAAAVPTPKGPQGRLPSSSWSMLSAMAGGATGASPSNVTIKPPTGGVGAGAGSSKGGTGSLFEQQSRQPTTPVTAAVPKQPTSSRPASPLQGTVPNGSGSGPPIVSGRVPVVKPNKSPAPQQQPQGQSQDSSQQQERVTVGDYLAASLTAQSLDLPPAAARWRQQQRVEPLNKRRLIVWEVDSSDQSSDEEESSSGTSGSTGGGMLSGLLRGGQKKKKEVDIRDRMNNILQMDRDEGWEEPR